MVHEFYIQPLLEGLGTSAALIIAIGPQNAFVLKQGILKNHVFTTAFLCALIDAFLITIGVGGFGTFLASNALLLSLSKWCGAVFLFYYGFRSFLAVLHSDSLETDLDHGGESLKSTIFTILALSFLNPHAYLDTIVLIGGIGAQFPSNQRLYFAEGAVIASFIWFFTITYGARYLGPLFKKPIAWKILDFLIGCIMWSISYSLVF